VPAIHRRFDYSVPPSLSDRIRVGSRVRVELHGRRVGAWVVEADVPATAGVTAKPLAASSGAGPPPSVVALAEWASWRWAGPLSSFLGTASPDRVVDERVPLPPLEVRIPDSPGGGSVALVDEALAGGPAPAVIRLAPALDATLVVLELVHRVGPSGVLVLAPSHARAAQVAARLREAGAPVALLPDRWSEASSGSLVVVGTRVAAWAPLPRLAGAVVLDAHRRAGPAGRRTGAAGLTVPAAHAHRRGPAGHHGPAGGAPGLAGGRGRGPHR
jgi:primosomal protein N' (replication factor Y)